MAGPEDVLDEESELVESENMREMGASPMCFLSAVRPCGAECLAFVTHPKLAKSSDLTEEQAHCAFISNAERVGRGSVLAANAMTDVAVSFKKFISSARNAAADKLRTSSLSSQATTSPFGKGTNE